MDIQESYGKHVKQTNKQNPHQPYRMYTSWFQKSYQLKNKITRLGKDWWKKTLLCRRLKSNAIELEFSVVVIKTSTMGIYITLAHIPLF